MKRIGRIARHLPASTTAAAEAQQAFPFDTASRGHAGYSVRVTPGEATSTQKNIDEWGLVERLVGKGRRVWKLELVEDATDTVVAWCFFVEQDVRVGSAAVVSDSRVPPSQVACRSVATPSPPVPWSSRFGDSLIACAWPCRITATCTPGVQVCGNVSGVGCWAEHRRKGHAGVVIEAAVAFMKEKGFMVTMLLGIPNFYYQFGYISIGVQHTVAVKASTVAERLPAAGPDGLLVADATEADVEDMWRLYAAENELRSCTLVRPLEQVQVGRAP
jgi:hypothetical protein